MIYFTGDLHRDIDISKLNTKNFPDQKNLSKEDYVIICGDFGCIWDGSNSDKYWLKWLEQKSFTTLFVDGNHENFNLLYEYPTMAKFNGTVGVINHSVFHLRRGEVYTIDNKKIFTFGGARSHDIESREKDVTWWEDEMPTQSEFDYGLEMLKKHNFNIDIIVSHTCPESIFMKLQEEDQEVTELERYLEGIRNMLDLKETEYKWYFGHFHKDMCIDDSFYCLYKTIKAIR